MLVGVTNATNPLGSDHSKVLDFVDSTTRKSLETAADVDAINSILSGSSVRWATHARCLRHPFKEGGCRLPENADLDSF